MALDVLWRHLLVLLRYNFVIILGISLKDLKVILEVDLLTTKDIGQSIGGTEVDA